jgi:hypothetical protein
VTRRGHAPAALLCAGLLGAPGLVHAQSTTETARACFVAAARLGQEGRWKEARELFARSLQLRPSPVTLYSLGVAQRETGHLAEALGSFRAFVAEPATAASQPFLAPAQRAILELDGRVARVIIAIQPSRPAGLSLTIDGQPGPALMDGPREVDPGGHDVMASAPGFRSAQARFSANPGAPDRLVLVLTLAPPGTSDGIPSPASSAPPPPAIGTHRALPLVLLGAGGGLFTTGVAVGLAGVGRAGHAASATGAEAHTARAMALAGDVMAGLGLASAGVGLVLFLVAGRSTPPAPSGVTLWTGAGLAGLETRF